MGLVCLDKSVYDRMVAEDYAHAVELEFARARKEERLRDAVVASADAWESTRSKAWRDDLAINIRALRAHREKVG